MSSSKRKQTGYYYTRGKQKKHDKLLYSMYALGIIYFAGAIGLKSSAYSELLIPYIPFIILLSVCLLFFNHSNWDIRFVYYLIILSISGFLISLWGLNTGKVFGPMTFGKTLGYKISGVPVIMSAIWVMLICSAGFMMKNMKIKAVFRALIGAFALVLLDMVLEPFAERFDFWSWGLDHGRSYIPTQNYVAWFLFSFAGLFYFNIIRVKLRNNFGTFLFILNVAFFLFCVLFRVD